MTVLPGYVLDLPAETTAAFEGRPVLLANSIRNATYTELAKKPIAPPSETEVAFSSAMKVIGPSFTALRSASQESKADDVTANAAKLQPAFTQAETIWNGLGLEPAAQLARDARASAAAIERAAAAGDWDAVKESAAALNQLCQICHASYRERQDDGTFRFKLLP